MFSFHSQGEVVGMIAGKDGLTYLRLKPVNPFQFKRQGEVPGLLQVDVPSHVDCKGLCIGQLIEVSGQGAVGKHDWTKKEFGKEKTKEISNYYFLAEKIAVSKATK